MKNIIVTALALLSLLGCHQDSDKVARQKAIYFSVSDVPRVELEREITRNMEIQHLSSPGKAMIYSLDQSIIALPQIEAIVDKAAIQAGIQRPPKNSLDEAEGQIKVAKEIRTLSRARDAIAKIEAETAQ
jgi:hypothetical protein